jgi:hypothetical protein
LSNSYVTIDSNVTSLGSSANTPNRGTTANQPKTANIGDFYFNTDINELQLYSKNGWVNTATPPNAPTNISVTSAPVAYGGQPSVIVTWVPATIGTPASSYTITSSTGGFSQTVTTNTATFIGLTAGTSYTFTVTAKNDYGSNSTTSASITPVTSPQQVTNVTAVAGSGQATVSFTANGTGGATPTYYVYSNPGNIVAFGASSPITITGLTVASNYTFTVIATNSAGSSPASASSNSINAAVVASTGQVLNLDASVGNSYGGENLYRASNNPANGSYWNYSAISIGSLSGTLPNGTTGTIYHVMEDNTTNQHLLFQSTTTTQASGDLYTISGYFKAAERTQVSLTSWGGSYVVFDLSAGVVLQNGGADVSATSITSAGNGWYYCSTTFAVAVAGNPQKYIIVWNNGNNYAGTTGYGIYYYDAQVRRNAVSPAGFISNPGTSNLINNGTTWTDLSTNALNGTLNATPTYSYTSGANGSQGLGYLLFNPTSYIGQFVSFPTNANVQFLGTSPYTEEAWAYITSTPVYNSYQGIFNRESPNGSISNNRDGYNLWYNGNETPTPTTMALSTERFGVAAGTTPSVASASFTTPVSSFINKWFHIVATYDGSTLSIYLNGVLQSTTSPSVTWSITNTAQTLQIANRAGANFQGRVATARIYNRAISATEVSGNFAYERSRFGV